MTEYSIQLEDDTNQNEGKGKYSGELRWKLWIYMNKRFAEKMLKTSAVISNVWMQHLVQINRISTSNIATKNTRNPTNFYQ